MDKFINLSKQEMEDIHGGKKLELGATVATVGAITVGVSGIVAALTVPVVGAVTAGLGYTGVFTGLCSQYELASIAAPDLCALRAQFTIQIRAHPKRSVLTQSELELPLSFICHSPPTLALRGGRLLRLS